jgi:membrane protease YdiL (CAAX protease family)
MRLGLVLWSLFFAYGHVMQGIDNAAGAGVLGFLFGVLYIWRRNLVAPIVAHAAYDVTTLLIYWCFIKT